MAVLTSLVLLAISKTQNTALPKYNLVDGETLSFKVAGKVEIQPYAIGGTLTLKTKKKGNDLWMAEITHNTEFIAEGETSPGGPQMSVWEMEPNLKPTGSGEGANLFGEQLMAILVLPTQEKEKFPYFSDSSVFVTTATKDGDFIKVTSKISNPGGEHVVDRFLNAKTLKLVKGKCLSTTGIGKTTYELSPIK
jgi:hypothetical protein